jgi:UDP:flavonoid glycosyltransferase YjiC (YdhE family)
MVHRHVPQLALLPHVDAVVCHGGHNTVCESLAHGLPLVIAPIKDDQPIVQPPELRDAIHRVLVEPGFRAAAARVRDSFAKAGGAPAAATALEGLL